MHSFFGESFLAKITSSTHTNIEVKEGFLILTKSEWSDSDLVNPFGLLHVRSWRIIVSMLV